MKTLPEITDRKRTSSLPQAEKYTLDILRTSSFSPYVNDAVVVGDRRKYLVCLIMIDEDNVVKFAQDNKIQFSTYKDLTQAPEIIRLIQGELDKVNETLSQVEKVKKFTILPKKLYEEDGEVTPTMKVKRKYVNQAFTDLIERMYKGKE
jgi:long-chain acyl-CoA synthetase